MLACVQAQNGLPTLSTSIIHPKNKFSSCDNEALQCSLCVSLGRSLHSQELLVCSPTVFVCWDIYIWHKCPMEKVILQVGEVAEKVTVHNLTNYHVYMELI